MSDDRNPWFRLGYAMERARISGASALSGEEPEEDDLPAHGLKGLRERVADLRDRRKGTGSVSTDALILTGIASLSSEVLKRWPRRSRPGPLGLVRGAAAGAAAALAVEVLTSLMESEELDPEALAGHIALGVGEGILFSSVLEPRLPGPPALRGAVAGTAAYFLAPLGGMGRILRPLSPVGKIPVLNALLEGAGEDDRGFVEFLALGVILAVLYGEGESSGTGPVP